MKQKTAAAAPAKPGPGYLPRVMPGKYADGIPYDQLRYLECKLILRPNHFTSRDSLFDFGKLMRRPAKESGARVSSAGWAP